MHLTRLQKSSKLVAIVTEWNNLLQFNAIHVPFLRNEYLSSWWKYKGGGEWQHGELNVVTARTDEGNLCGVAPLFFTENLDKEPALMLLGSIEISDYLDFIAPTSQLEPFLKELFVFWAKPKIPAWKVIDLYNLQEDSPTIPILFELCNQMGWQIRQDRLQPAPHIPLPADWESYLAGIKKKHRHEIRRKMRRAANYHLPVKWYFVEDEATLDTEIDELFRLMAYDPEKEAFLTDTMRNQMRSIIHTGFKTNWLQMAFFEVGGEKACVYLNFDFDNKIWVYNSGIDFKYRDLSPGWVLLGHLIQWAIENGRETFDFMRGDEVYKYRFGGINKHVVRVQIQR